jgi:hypothetical protein
VTKQGTGVAGNGNMLLKELDDRLNLEDTNLLDDLEFFMLHDDKFFRRVLYPQLLDIKHKLEAGKACEDTCLRASVDRAATIYCKKFNIPDPEKSVFTDVDRDAVARSIFGKEQDNIAQGKYDGRPE